MCSNICIIIRCIFRKQCRLIVAQMSDVRCDGFNLLFWPLLATVAVSCFPWYEQWLGCEISADMECWILQALTIFVTVAHLHYGKGVVSTYKRLKI